MDIEAAIQTQLANIQKKTGLSLDSLNKALGASGLKKHGELRDFAKQEWALGHGDANTLVTLFLRNEQGPGPDDPLDAIYSGPKEALRPIHEAIMQRIQPWGDFEIAPKKANVSLRRKKQFALIGPATNTRFEVGINMKDVTGTDRLLAQPPGGMCQYIVKLTSVEEVDDELIGWIKTAYESSK